MLRIRAAGGLDGAGWLMVLDADEFLNVHVGGHRVRDLTATAPPEVDIVALNGVTFAPAPQLRFDPRPVCAQFPWAMPARDKVNRPVKSLTRGPHRFGQIHNHSMVGWRGKGPLRVMYADGRVRELPGDQPLWKNLRETPVEEIAHDLAQYNHYAVKTWDSYMLRRDRGRGAVPADGPEQRRHTRRYFLDRARAARREESIARYAPEVAARMAALLADPAVRAAHEAAVAAHAARCAVHALTTPPEIAALSLGPLPAGDA